MSRWWRRGRSASATAAATRRSSARTTCCRATRASTRSRCKLWEGLEQDLNYNVMMSQRGVLNIFHTDAERDFAVRRGNSMRLQGVDAELLDRGGGSHVAARWRRWTTRCSRSSAGSCSRAAARRGTTRSIWGFARAADRRGVDIIEHCEVTGIRREGGKVVGVETTRGFIGAGKVGVAVAGNTSRLAAMAGLTLPVETISCRPSCPRRSSPISTASRPSAPVISISASPTRAGSCSAATSTATIPMRSAAIFRWSSI